MSTRSQGSEVPLETSTQWPLVHEALGQTLRRTIGIALFVGSVFALTRHEWRVLLPMALLALWPSLGGHYIEIAFLNQLRPRLPSHRAVQLVARLALWLVAGVVLYVLMSLSARALPVRPFPLAFCWLGGPAFVMVEVVAHCALALRGRPSFFNGQG